MNKFSLPYTRLSSHKIDSYTDHHRSHLGLLLFFVFNNYSKKLN